VLHWLAQTAHTMVRRSGECAFHVPERFGLRADSPAAPPRSYTGYHGQPRAGAGQVNSPCHNPLCACSRFPAEFKNRAAPLAHKLMVPVHSFMARLSPTRLSPRGTGSQAWFHGRARAISVSAGMLSLAPSICARFHPDRIHTEDMSRRRRPVKRIALKRPPESRSRIGQQRWVEPFDLYQQLIRRTIRQRKLPTITL